MSERVHGRPRRPRLRHRGRGPTRSTSCASCCAAAGGSRSSPRTAIVDARRRRGRDALDARGHRRTRRSPWATARTRRRSRRSTTSAAGSREWGLLRGDVVVAVGGGVVGDTAGFAAAVVLPRASTSCRCRPRCSRWSTRAIGGKTGVNLPEGKNLVGAFHQPTRVFANPAVLATLPDREYRCGLGEVAKYALMGDDFVARARSTRCVARDPRRARRRDRALRRRSRRASSRPTSSNAPACAPSLNYGHTLGARARDRDRPRAACTAKRSRSASCSRRSSRRRSSASPPERRRPAPRRSSARSACRVGAARAARRRPARDHGARQEVGGRAHVRARRAERDRAGRRPRPGRGAQGPRRDRSGGADGDDPVALRART